MINYTNLLREHHLKATPQRIAIAELLDTRGHVTLEAMYEVMRKKFDSISLATIYKNVNLMMKNAFIQEVKLPNTKAVYELTKERHAHLVCDACSSVEDIHFDLEGIINQSSLLEQFNVKSANLVLTGTCKNCK